VPSGEQPRKNALGPFDNRGAEARLEALAPHAPSVQRGDLFWLVADAAPPRPARVAHPHRVIQEDVFNRARINTVIVCALTSNLHRAHEPGNVLLEVGEGDLPVQSVLVVSQISSVDKSRLGAYIGALSPRRVEQVLDGLRFQQASFFR
jgi:mRNA interferase MazF